MSVNSEVERVLKDFHGAKKPIGLCCIAPIVAAKVLGTSGVTLTLGKAGKTQHRQVCGVLSQIL